MRWTLTLLAIIVPLTVLAQPTDVTDGTSPDDFADLYQISEAVEELGRYSKLSPDSRLEWAQRIIDADAEFGLDYPYVLTAIIRRESAFWNSVWLGRLRGKRGELGAMQIHPSSGWRQFQPSGCQHKNLYNMTPQCSFRTGVNMLSHMFRECPGSLWRKVASYKYGRCVSEEAARLDFSAKQARRFYCMIRPDCDESWPID